MGDIKTSAPTNSDESFYNLIREAEIACTSFPLAGVHILLPLGRELLGSIEQTVLSRFVQRGYREAGLPEVVPPDFMSHLRDEGLFKVRNEHHEFYMAAATEVQAALLAKALIKSPKDMPLRVFSRGNFHRTGSYRKSLIKDLEFRLVEFNAFFETEEEALQEEEWVSRTTAQCYEELGIPGILVREGLHQQKKFYGYFPFSDSFGAIFCTSFLSDKHTSMFPIIYRADHPPQKVHQLNAGFTGRALVAYLANHCDEKGFLLDPEISPYQAYLCGGDFSRERAEKIKAQLTENRINPLLVNLQSQNRAYRQFIQSGFPLFIGAGTKQIKLRSRLSTDVQWISEEELIGLALSIMENYSIPKKPNPLVGIYALDVPSLDSVVRGQAIYAPLEKEPEFRARGLKYLGGVPSGEVVFVRQKY